MSAPIEGLEVLAAGLTASALLRRLHADELQFAVIRGWYPRDVLAGVHARLESLHEHPLWQDRDHTDRARRQTRVLGQPASPSDLHPQGPDPDAYFADAARFRDLLRELFPPAHAYEPRLHELLATLAGPVRIEPARDAAGREYGLATIRHMPVGVGLPPHCENDYMHIPVYRSLAEGLQLPLQLSLFMPLALPEQGGQLVLHDARWGSPGTPSGAGDPGEFMQRPHRVLDLGPGDLVIFPAGRIFHSVRPGSGAGSRWTMGGFGAFSADDRCFAHWA